MADEGVLAFGAMAGRRSIALLFVAAVATLLFATPAASSEEPPPDPATSGGVGPGREAVPGGFAETVRVPSDAATIQDAVDAARPGGMVLIDPGVYRESVTVTTPFLTIRGMDRNRVVIDGDFGRAIGIHVIEADGVTIENLTVRNHLLYRIRAVRSIEPAAPIVDEELTVFGTPLATSWWSLLIGLYGYVLPGILYAAWVTIALWDLIRQESQPISFRARWMAVVLLVPFAGPLLYFASGSHRSLRSSD